jgi:hypothetical protein
MALKIRTGIIIKMSGAALSSAKQRRSVLKDSQAARGFAPPPPTPPPQLPPQKQQVIPIPQALSMFERRINILEQTVKSLGTSSPLIIPSANNNDEILEMKDSIHRLNEMMTNSQDMIEDMHTFATELDNLKNTIIKLQTYTMDVNRMLLEQKSQNTTTEPIVMDIDTSV